MEAKDEAQGMLLCEQLGYPTDLSTFSERLRQITATKDRAVFVACDGDAVLGWIDVSVETHLQSSSVALIAGLVVSESARGQGIGRELCRVAEGWARDHGLSRVRVRSNVMRQQTHAFYQREGYGHVKTSAVFEKELPTLVPPLQPAEP